MSKPNKLSSYNWVDMIILAVFLALIIFVPENNPYRDIISIGFGVYVTIILSVHMLRNVIERGADKHVVTYVYMIAFIAALIFAISMFYLYQYITK